MTKVVLDKVDFIDTTDEAYPIGTFFYNNDNESLLVVIQTYTNNEVEVLILASNNDIDINRTVRINPFKESRYLKVSEIGFSIKG